MSENLSDWNSFCQPPDWALKKITGGRLSGKTDIKPQWRYYAMTDTYGPCGIGWKFEINHLWNEPAPDGGVFAFARISLYIKNKPAGGSHIWSDAIPGVGGSMIIQKEHSGLHANDEGFKMAVTDALGTAMKLLGVAADIYSGLFDGSKYKNLLVKEPIVIAEEPSCMPEDSDGSKASWKKEPDFDKEMDKLEDKFINENPKVVTKVIEQNIKDFSFYKKIDAYIKRIGEPCYRTILREEMGVQSREEIQDPVLKQTLLNKLDCRAKMYTEDFFKTAEERCTELGEPTFALFVKYFLKKHKINLNPGQKARDAIKSYKDIQAFKEEMMDEDLLEELILKAREEKDNGK